MPFFFAIGPRSQYERMKEEGISDRTGYGFIHISYISSQVERKGKKGKREKGSGGRFHDKR